jgi:excisionase family DNA binding protein
MSEEKILTVNEAAVLLGLDTSHVRLLIRQGKLPATRHGGVWLLKAVDVAGFERRPVGRPAKSDALMHANAIEVIVEKHSKKPAKKYDHLSVKYPKLSRLLNGIDAKGDEDENEVAEMIALTVLLREKGILTKERLLELEETGAIKPVPGSESLRKRSAQSQGEETISTMAGFMLDE